MDRCRCDACGINFFCEGDDFYIYMRLYADKTFVSARSENASSLYWAEQAVKWDSSNWQAHQSKAILYDLRYYSLTLSKKLELAHREKSAYEEVYFYNIKSPMTCS